LAEANSHFGVRSKVLQVDEKGAARRPGIGISGARVEFYVNGTFVNAD
jgi:hypothetical protein